MSQPSNLSNRILTSFFIVPAVMVFIFIENRIIIIPLYVLAVALMAKEFYGLTFPIIDGDNNSEVKPDGEKGHLINKKLGFAFIMLGALLTSLLASGSLSQIGQIVFLSDERVILGLMLLEFLTLSFTSVFLNKEFGASFRDQQIHLFLFFYLNFIFFHILKLKYFFITSSPLLHDLSAFYLLLAFGICWFFDSGAYLFGRKWGNKKMGLHVSPQKSWEGFFAGLLSTFLGGGLVSWALHQIYPRLWEKSFFADPYLPWIIYPTLGLVAQWGDLIASLHKRSSGVKDSGSFIKGHGGFYDRNDSVILVAVIFYYFLYFYHR